MGGHPVRPHPLSRENVMSEFTIELHPDYDSDPSESECYDEDDIARFRAGDWRYVGVIVTCVMADDGATVTVQSSGLWGVEWGLNPEGNAYVLSVATEQWDEAVSR